MGGWVGQPKSRGANLTPPPPVSLSKGLGGAVSHVGHVGACGALAVRALWSVPGGVVCSGASRTECLKFSPLQVCARE